MVSVRSRNYLRLLIGARQREVDRSKLTELTAVQTHDLHDMTRLEDAVRSFRLECALLRGPFFAVLCDFTGVLAGRGSSGVYRSDTENGKRMQKRGIID